MINPPIILTLSFDKEAHNFFNTLRQQHFPRERNFINAHLTLFHALPNEPAVIDTVQQFCLITNEFSIQVLAPVSIGNGVAFKLESKELMIMHKALQNKWLAELSLQDKQKIWPHITIQNKVPALEAKQLLEKLRNEFVPFKITATGLQLWEYLNGPWKFVEEAFFKPDSMPFILKEK